MAEITYVWVIEVTLNINDTIYTRYLSKLTLEGTIGYMTGTLEFGTIDEAFKMSAAGKGSISKLYDYVKCNIDSMPHVIYSTVAEVPYQPATDTMVYFHKNYMPEIVRVHPELNRNCIFKARPVSLRAIDAIEIGGLLWDVYEVDPLNGIYRLLCTDEDLIETADPCELGDAQRILQEVDKRLQKSPDYDKLMWATNPEDAEARKVSMCNYFPYQCGRSVLPSNQVYWGAYGRDEKPIRIYPREIEDDIRTKCMVPAAFDYDLSGTALVIPSIAVKLPTQDSYL